MKYKVGDKVRIKTWKEMEEEFGLDNEGRAIQCRASFTKTMETEISSVSLIQNRTVTIKEICQQRDYGYYRMKELTYQWTDDMIAGLASSFPENKQKNDSILSRWEILDI